MEMTSIHRTSGQTFGYVPPMKIGILGTGKMGTALGRAFARLGHDVVFGTSDPERGARLNPGARVVSHRDAAEHGEMLVLATRWENTEEVLRASAPFDGKVLMSCVNPATETEALAVGHTTSAAEEIARWAPTARVVEAFNGTYSEAVNLSPENPTGETVFLCGDDDAARRAVADLTKALGFDPLDAGPLRNARYLEPLAALVVYLVRKAGYGPLGIHQEWKRNRA
jgi:8-hydroxy-5-deazaflavin:NADPH oxidoreductase